ncbi:unnamed protein product [Ambrosiozyma monospora]|uniref:Unnamed protein product n=1 Tax=Ambrosiozyma monospora TaxID=43982 RepID=A0A9W7DJ15_AMBMO|nr:unnamed protein product [Ambrosiozyma monospora]
MTSSNTQIIFHPLSLLNISDILQRVSVCQTPSPLVGILLGISSIDEDEQPPLLKKSILMSFDVSSFESSAIVEKLKLLEQVYAHMKLIGFFHISNNLSLSSPNFQFNNEEITVLKTLQKLSEELKQLHPSYIEQDLIHLIISSDPSLPDQQQSNGTKNDFLPLKVVNLNNPDLQYQKLEVKMIQSEKVAMNSIAKASQTTTTSFTEGKDVHLFEQSTKNVQAGLLNLQDQLNTILSYLNAIQNGEVSLYGEDADLKQYQLVKNIDLAVKKLKSIKRTGTETDVKERQLMSALVNESLIKENLNLMVELGASDKA